MVSSFSAVAFLKSNSHFNFTLILNLNLYSSFKGMLNLNQTLELK